MPIDVQSLLGADAESLLGFDTPKISRDRLQLPGPDFVDRVLAHSDRNNRVLRNLSSILGSGRLAGTGYVSILPVDQGIEHSAGGMGLISGRKAFQRPLAEGVELLNAIQDVYLDKTVTVA